MTIHQRIDDKTKNSKSKPGIGPVSKAHQSKSARVKQKSVTIEAPAIKNFEKSDRKEVLTMVGKELASDLSSRVILRMLAASGKTMRQVARESGFDVSVLSNIANGKRASGPDLWTLAALAEAMDLDLELNFATR